MIPPPETTASSIFILIFAKSAGAHTLPHRSVDPPTVWVDSVVENPAKSFSAVNDVVG